MVPFRRSAHHKPNAAVCRRADDALVHRDRDPLAYRMVGKRSAAGEVAAGEVRAALGTVKGRVRLGIEKLRAVLGRGGG